VELRDDILLLTLESLLLNFVDFFRLILRENICEVTLFRGSTRARFDRFQNRLCDLLLETIVVAKFFFVETLRPESARTCAVVSSIPLRKSAR